MDSKKSSLRSEQRLHDATTPPVAASLEASDEALTESALVARQPDLAPLVEIFEAEVEATGYLDVLNKLAIIYLVTGRPQDAVPLLERCVEGNPEYIEAWANLAFTRLQLGLASDAGTIFPRILKNRASSSEIHNLYGLFFALQGNYSEAILEYERALLFEPGYELAHNNLALAYEALGQRKKAIKHFQSAGSLQPLYNDLGIFRDGVVGSEAVENFRAKVQGNPLRALAYYEAAFFYAAQEESEKALSILGEALVIEPDYARYYTALGFLEMTWGSQSEAEAHLKRVLEIDPGAYEAHIHLGFYYGEEERMDLVLDHFGKAVDLRPYYPDLQFNLGEGLLNEEDYAGAIACFNRALTINPYYGMALFKLGYAQQESDKLEQAIDSFTRLKALDPEFPDIDKFLNNAQSRSKPTVTRRKKKG